MADREEIDFYRGHPGFASGADEKKPRCPNDGGYFYESDKTCEYCGRTLEEINQEGA